MIRFYKIAIPVFIVGFIAGNAFWYVFSPSFIDRVVNEQLPSGFVLSEARSGEFRNADGAHRGSGSAKILVADGGGALLRFTEFQVTNGPDLEVWLVKDPDPKKSADVNASQWLSLGPLKGNKGDQSYVIPDGTDINDWGSAVIWCEQFSVLFSVATLSQPKV
ncbi:electron transfer protein with DM13 domain [Hoeflea sp. IMCC20628]|uniref:DM13 domain-containing protein n=1 Tax=Hoeflea sp. IMCC20628 TaxID=1620421 RepID=UPI00063A98BD|nr:DM13 domain-containing protein [Hoeflea sp. IMCC20628]AKI00989.1 electron transfer protein with DM13 domain [Hoeflea sp. IMCC20628]